MSSVPMIGPPLSRHGPFPANSGSRAVHRLMVPGSAGRTAPPGTADGGWRSGDRSRTGDAGVEPGELEEPLVSDDRVPGDPELARPPGVERGEPPPARVERSPRREDPLRGGKGGGGGAPGG